MIRRRRRRAHSPLAAMRERYAAGHMSIGEFEVTVEACLRAEDLPDPPRRRPTAQEAAEQWSTAAAAHADNYVTALIQRSQA